MKRDSIALAAICLAALMFGLEISSVPSVLPVLGAELGSSFTDLQWIVNSYTLASTTVLIATGTLADRYGRRRVLSVAVVAFGITSAVCALAPTTGVLVAGRALQGLSGGAMLIGQVAILGSQFRDGAARTRAFGTWGIVFGSGLGFGPIVGAGLDELLGWRWVFGVHTLLAAVTVLLVVRTVTESRDATGHRLDVAGLAALSTAVFATVLLITQAPEWGLASPVTLAVLALAALSAVVFVAVERRHPRPAIDFAVFRIPAFSGALLGAVGMNASFWPLIVYVPIALQDGLGLDVTTAGAVLLAYTLPTLLLPPVAERWAARSGAGVVVPAGLGLIALGFAAVAVGSTAPEPSAATLLPGLLLAGCGLGLTNTPVTNTTTGAVPAERSGMASGIDMSARMITLAVTIAVMGLVLAAGTADHLGTAVDPERAAEVGRLVAGGDPAGLPPAVAGAALVHGFSLVAAFGAAAAGVLAVGSRALFRAAERQESGRR